jgi:hypothetical protein
VDKSDLNFVKMRILNHLSDHVCLVGTLFNESSESPEKAITNHKPAYKQLNQYEAAFKMLRKHVSKEVFQYREPNANTAKHCCEFDIPVTKVHLKRMMNYR